MQRVGVATTRSRKNIEKVGSIKEKGFWKSRENQREFLDTLFERLSLKQLEDWKKVTVKQFRKNGGGGLLNHYKFDIRKLLESAYSNYAWDFLPKKRLKPRGYWNDKENQLSFLTNLSSTSSKISTKTIIENGGGTLLRMCRGNINNFLKEVYLNNEKASKEGNDEMEKTKTKELVAQRVRIPKKKDKGYWNNPQNRVDFMNKLYKDFKLQSIDDWKNISTGKIVQSGGKTLLSKYRGYYELLTDIYPNHKWVFDEKTMKEKGYWQSIDHQINFMESVYHHQNVKSFDEFGRVKKKQIIEMGGRGLLSHFKEDLQYLFISIYPNYPWSFKNINTKKGNGYWNKLDNQIKFFENLKKKLKIHCVDDWLFVRTKDIIDHGGLSVLKLYSFDLPLMLSTIFPSSPWNFDNFYHLKHIRLKQKLLSFQKQYRVQRKEDWYRISGEDLFKSIGGLYSVLMQIHPNEKWEKYNFVNRSKKSKQRQLIICTQQIYPQFNYLEDYNHPKLFSRLGIPLEIDLFIPSLNYGFEYQGEQHYDDIPSAFSTLIENQNRDREKFALCKSHSIHLIAIPFWWNLSSNSLVSTISKSLM